MAILNRFGNKAEIGVGDKVFLFSYGIPSVCEIAEVTPAGNFKIKGLSGMFNSNGDLRGGGSYSRTYIAPYNETDAVRYESDKRRRVVSARVRDAVSGRAESLPAEVWDALAAVLDAHTANSASEANIGLHIPAEQAVAE